jgi:hypothetical protein
MNFYSYLDRMKKATTTLCKASSVLARIQTIELRNMKQGSYIVHLDVFFRTLPLVLLIISFHMTFHYIFESYTDFCCHVSVIL